MRQRAQWIFVLGIVGVLVGGLTIAMALQGPLQPLGIGSQAPDFEAVDVYTGRPVSLTHFSGQVVLLNIWETSCLACEDEMPSMERLHRQLGDSGLRIVAVSVDPGSMEPVRHWAEDRALTFDILQDPSQQIERSYLTTGVPESFVIDRDGIIMKHAIGAVEWDQPGQQVLLRNLLDRH